MGILLQVLSAPQDLRQGNTVISLPKFKLLFEPLLLLSFLLHELDVAIGHGRHRLVDLLLFLLMRRQGSFIAAVEALHLALMLLSDDQRENWLGNFIVSVNGRSLRIAVSPGIRDFDGGVVRGRHLSIESLRRRPIDGFFVTVQLRWRERLLLTSLVDRRYKGYC